VALAALREVAGFRIRPALKRNLGLSRAFDHFRPWAFHTRSALAMHVPSTVDCPVLKDSNLSGEASACPEGLRLDCPSLKNCGMITETFFKDRSTIAINNFSLTRLVAKS
jgi:hypothetical protein